MSVIDDAHKLVAEAQRSAREKLERRRHEIDQQIAPLEAERRALQRALQELGTKKLPRDGRKTASPPRVSREERHQQVLDLVHAQADLTTAELGRLLGLSPNRATALVKELRDAGQLHDGQPLRAVDERAEPSAV